MTKATNNTMKLTADEKRALAAIIETCDNLDGDLFTRPADAVLAIIDTLGCSGQAAGGYITSLGNKGILDTEEDGYGLGFWVNVDTIDEEEFREVGEEWLYMECKDSISVPGPGDFIEWNDTEIPVRGGAWAEEMNAHLYTVIDTISFWDRWPFLVCQDNAEGIVFALKGTLSDDAALPAAPEPDLGGDDTAEADDGGRVPEAFRAEGDECTGDYLVANYDVPTSWAEQASNDDAAMLLRAIINVEGTPMEGSTGGCYYALNYRDDASGLGYTMAYRVDDLGNGLTTVSHVRVYRDERWDAEEAPESDLDRAMGYKAERMAAEAESILRELRSLRADIDGRIEAIEALMEGAEAHDIDSVGRIQYEAKWAEVAIRQAHRGVNEANANLRGNIEAWGTLNAVRERMSAR